MRQPSWTPLKKCVPKMFPTVAEPLGEVCELPRTLLWMRLGLSYFVWRNIALVIKCLILLGHQRQINCWNTLNIFNFDETIWNSHLQSKINWLIRDLRKVPQRLIFVWFKTKANCILFKIKDYKWLIHEICILFHVRCLYLAFEKLLFTIAYYSISVVRVVNALTIRGL